MGVFRRVKGGVNHARASIVGGQEAKLSIVAAGARIVGGLETDGDLRVEGKVDGNVRAHGQVLVAPGGTVEGDILTHHAIIGGDVSGQILADELVELRSGGVVRGDIATPRIAVEEGGALNGYLRTAGSPVSAERLFGSEPPPTHPASRRGVRDHTEVPSEIGIDRIRPAS